MSALYVRLPQKASRMSMRMMAERLYRRGFTCRPYKQPPNAPLWRFFKVTGNDLQEAEKLLLGTAEHVTYNADSLYYLTDGRRASPKSA